MNVSLSVVRYESREQCTRIGDIRFALITQQTNWVSKNPFVVLRHRPRHFDQNEVKMTSRISSGFAKVWKDTHYPTKSYSGLMVLLYMGFVNWVGYCTKE